MEDLKTLGNIVTAQGPPQLPLQLTSRDLGVARPLRHRSSDPSPIIRLRRFLGRHEALDLGQAHLEIVGRVPRSARGDKEQIALATRQRLGSGGAMS